MLGTLLSHRDVSEDTEAQRDQVACLELSQFLSDAYPRSLGFPSMPRSLETSSSKDGGTTRHGQSLPQCKASRTGVKSLHRGCSMKMGGIEHKEFSSRMRCP